MKIASFVYNQRADCGVVDSDGIRALGQHPRFAETNPESRLLLLLGLSPDERRAIAAELRSAPRIPFSAVRLLPAVPSCPLYLYGHGNNPTVWQRQTDRPWEFTRVPYLRIRPFTAFSGDGWTVPVSPGATVMYGAELGVVLGRDARRVSPAEAAGCIAGLVVENDLFARGRHDEFIEPPGKPLPMQNQGLDTVYKAADGHAAFGPWITTVEDLEADSAAHFEASALERYRARGLSPSVYDRWMTTWRGERRLDESHTSSYLWGAEMMISYLSRFMTLPAGTVLGLGAAGWDGCPAALGPDEGSTAEVAVELSGVGRLRTHLFRRSAGERNSSPYLAARRDLGLDPVPAASDRPGPAFWVLRGNYRTCQECEGISPQMGMNPLLLPPRSLGGTDTPIELPPHATDVYASAQLAAVIGNEPVYNVTRENAWKFLRGIAPLLAVRDASLAQAIPNPTAYENRGTHYLGCCGDGFYRLGPIVPVPPLSALANLELTIRVTGLGAATYRAREYRYSFADLLAMVSRTGTLLPGDVLALGVAGPELRIPANQRVAEMAVSTDWAEPFRLPVVDQRDSVVSR